ncbi:hypothetical protein CONLIGDRAFT_628045 [Coniochaeta ligniaria NRRL 30616]|uniref:Uncharacterized protein n=1 Tax=Coniochaeta ligniaria NRRL 30616 TaxID=1408157 RepID=A0A1J7JIC5_9PEZI|nr:hypothetical protein CONLIGDRAFT_628045 [Coniochaeta ligniaria NRRL 30616]
MAKPNDTMSLTGYDSESAPPPQYSETAVEAGSSSSSAGPVAGLYRPFPPAFTAHYQKKLLTTVFFLGEDAARPLYAVKIPGWRTSTVDLHNGPGVDDPLLASARDGGRWGCHAQITLPPLPGAASGSASSVEPMHSSTGLTKSTFSFAVEVSGEKQATHRENFEWRSSRGKDIPGLEKAGRGWVLVRLGGGAGNETPEVVAYWGHTSGWSLRKGHRFQFLNSGLTGELGERWAVMAVITALRIWYKEFETAMVAAAVS